MSLAPKARLGPYEIVGPLGAGGMGEVYRARDTKLNRDVAIKVLPELFAADPERLARFTREAQTLAALNHPNIAHVYGVMDLPAEAGSHAISAGPIHALVMELVEGEDLAQQIARGPTAIPDALRIARQIADAVEAAHERGIVHRDLKPANVKVTPDGTVKVLDFGLAKAMAPEGVGQGVSPDGVANSPTFSMHATQLGVILGTAAYMSPEQARGKAVDKRADIWAFGVVLFELITGRRLFDGEDTTAVLARVLERDPEWSWLPASTPPAVRGLLERCLMKDPKARLRDIGEARLTLDEITANRSPVAAPMTRPGSRRQAWLPWGLSVAMAIAAAYFYVRTPSAGPMPKPLRADVVLPPEVEFFSGPSLSADASKFAFIGVRQGVRQVYVRSFEDREARAVDGTETAMSVAMSPDGAAVAFCGNDTRLKRVTLATGVVDAFGDGLLVYSLPWWVGNESIAFSRGTQIVVHTRDGTERVLASVDAAAGETQLLSPIAVAGDRTVVFITRRRGPREIVSRLDAVPVSGGPRHSVLDNVDEAIFAGPDRLVFQREGALFVQPFDATRVEVRGTPTRTADRVITSSLGGVGASVTASGTLLAASPAIAAGRLVWVSMQGDERPIPGVRGFMNPRVSPDGKLIAFSDNGIVWTLDPERGTYTRVSTGNDSTVGFPVWSPDGSRLYYRSAEGIQFHRADGEGQATVLPSTFANDYPTSFTPDGSTLVLLRLAPSTGGDIYTTPATGGEVKPLLVTNAYEGGSQVSPDGHWMLYVSNESGTMEVYLRPLRGPDRKWPLSTGGGMQALWSPDGRQVYYRSGQQVLVVDVTTEPDVKLSTPRVLFEKRWAFGQNVTIANYSISPNRREFLMIEEEPGGRYLNLVQNWLQVTGR